MITVNLTVFDLGWWTAFFIKDHCSVWTHSMLQHLYRVQAICRPLTPTDFHLQHYVPAFSHVQEGKYLPVRISLIADIQRTQNHKYLINKFLKSNQKNKMKERKSKISERSEMRRKGRTEGRKKRREGKKGGRKETRKRGRWATMDII